MLKCIPCQLALAFSPAVAALHMLVAFANSLDSDETWQNVGPDFDPNINQMVFLKYFFI